MILKILPKKEWVVITKFKGEYKIYGEYDNHQQVVKALTAPIIKMENIFEGPDAVSSTWFQGDLPVSYAKIVAKLGKPNSESDGYKVDAEWRGRINGLPFTIYNYKDGKNYLGRSGKAVANIKAWHIGGESKEVVDLLHKEFGLC